VIDRAEITAHGGDGGDGSVSFRREKYVPRGGPDGGDGGHGGSITIRADLSQSTLLGVARQRMYRAPNGVRGLGSKKHGRRGKKIRISVPEGTEVWKLNENGEKEKLADLVKHGQSVVAAQGGRGGWGNSRFATSTNRAPRIAQKGQLGSEVKIVLELKLLADVGIVGLPNAGKSTLLRSISAARPKVADYPFTTLEPVLGVVEMGWRQFVVADIPGLIEGAHEGAGLGLDFLRHIERTNVILHLVDGASDDPVRDYELINEELREYGVGLQDEPQLLAVNKIDIEEVREKMVEVEEAFRKVGTEVRFISGASGEGVTEVVTELGRMVQERKAPVPSDDEEEESEEVPTIRVRQRVEVKEENGGYRVEGERIVTFVEMMPIGVDEGVEELWRRFGRWGVTSALRRAGAKVGDKVYVGSAELEMHA